MPRRRTTAPLAAVVPFDAGVQDLLARTADDRGRPYVRAMSGAGQGAREIAAICPTAMVFVAGEHGGISHTPREFSNPDACADGTDVLANAVLRLANQSQGTRDKRAHTSSGAAAPLALALRRDALGAGWLRCLQSRSRASRFVVARLARRAPCAARGGLQLQDAVRST